MKRIIFAGFVFLLALPLNAQVPSTLTLEESIQIALKNSNELKRTELMVRSAEVAYHQARMNLLPTVNGNVTHGRNEGRSIDPFTNTYVNQTISYGSYNIGSSVNVFNGFSQQNLVKQSQYSKEAAILEGQQAEDNLTLNVILAYLRVLSNEDLVKQAEQQIAVTQNQIERLDVLNREGAINPPQLLDMKGRLKENELSKMTAQSAAELAKLDLLYLLNLPYDPAVKLQRVDQSELDLLPASVDQLYASAAEQLAVIKGAEMRRRSAAAGVKAVKGEIYPTVFLFGNANTNYSSGASREVFVNSTETPTNDYVVVGGTKTPVITTVNKYNSEKIGYSSQLKNNIFTNVGVGVRVPIFNGLQTRNRIRLAEIRLQEEDLAVNETKRLLRSEVEQSFVNMNNAYARYKLLIDQVIAYSESFRAAEVRYNAGVGTSVDYLIAKDNLDRANLNLVMAKYDYLLRKKIVEFYAGKR